MKGLVGYCLLLLLISAGCISKKKFNELKTEVDRKQLEFNRLQTIESEYNILVKNYNRIDKKLDHNEVGLRKLIDQYSALYSDYNVLMSQHERALLRTAQDSVAITFLQSKLDSLQIEQLKQPTITIEDRNFLVDYYHHQHLHHTLLDSLFRDLQWLIDSASSKDLSLNFQENVLVVSLSQELLFDKNSHEVRSQGKEWLHRLAPVLNNQSSLRISVVGHTDRDGDPRYNWDLSANRATSVLKEFIEFGVAPEIMRATGRSFYSPVDDGETSEAKAKNRRVELILSSEWWTGTF